MVMVSNLPNSSLPLNSTEDLVIVTQQNRLTKLTISEFIQSSGFTVNPSTVDHNQLLNYEANEHIDWTNAAENFLTTGTVNGGILSGTNTGDQNLFSTFSVLGLTSFDDINATTTNDTFTFVPGSNITITTNPTTKELFISSGGVSGGLPINVQQQSYLNPTDFDGSIDTLTLPIDPVNSDNVLIFFDGVFEGDSSYNIVGDQITFTTNIPSFVSKVDAFVYDEADVLFSRTILTAGVDYNIGDTSLSLPFAPVDNDHLLLFFGGAFQGITNYTTVGSTVNFTNPIPFGTNTIEAVVIADVGTSLLELTLNRQVYLDGVNFTSGLSDLLPLPDVVNSTEDVLVFFDSVFIGPENYAVNNTLIQFNAAIPSFTSKVEILTFAGGQSQSSLSFGIVEVPSQPALVASSTSDTLNILPGTNIDITTNPANNELTITNTQTIPSIFDTLTADTGSDLTATTSSTVNFVGGNDISVTSDGTDTLTIDFTGAITGQPDQNLFDRIQIGGVDQFTASTTTDPLNFEQGSNITLTNPSPNTIRIETSGGLGESNTSSSVNAITGQSLVLPKVGVDLPFKGIDTTDPNVLITSNATDVLVGLDIPTLEGNLNHDNLAGFVANEHIDWTNATQNLSTTGTVGSSNYDATGSVAAGSANSGTNTGDQNLWYTIDASSGPNFIPSVANDTLRFIGGTDIQVESNGIDTLTFSFDGTPGEANTADSPTQSPLGVGNLILPKIGTVLEFKGIDAGDTNVVIGSNPFDVTIALDIPNLEGNLNHDNLTGFVANEHIDWTNATQDILTTGTITGSNLSGTNTGDQNLFQTITVPTQSDVVADTTSDTLNLVAGADMAITTDPITDTITFAFDNQDAILESYTSAPQPISSGTQITLAHGLTGTPRIVHIDLLCVTSEAGYNAGDVANPFFVQASGNNRGAAVIETATDLIITYGSNAGVFMIINPATGSSTQITNTNWQMIVSAFR